MKIRVCHVLSDIDQSHLIETHGEIMDKSKYEIGFVFFGQKRPQLYDFFQSKDYFVEFFGFAGSKWELISAMLKLRKIFKHFQPDVVHTHLVQGSFAGLIAAQTLGIKNRIHTRHHGIESHVYYPKGVYYDRVINKFSKRIIAISQIVANALINLENVSAKKIVTIPHGFNLESFTTAPEDVENLKVKYELENHYPIIGSIARFIHWKGVQNTIRAFKGILGKYPRAKLILANATGPYKNEIHDLLKSTLPKDNYVTIEFERNVFALYKNMDAFVHVPLNRDFEAFGQVFIESLAMKVPSIFTLAGITNDFVKDKENALIVPFDDVSAVTESILSILENKQLRNKITDQGYKDVYRLFHQSHFGQQLDNLYTELIESTK